MLILKALKTECYKQTLFFFIGMLLTNDVRKIINYYNLLFDANFPLDQINSMLQRYSKNDQIHCDQVVGMLGKQIV